MEDRQIIALYHRRNEDAIAATNEKYGPLCRRIAGNILTVREDAEECVSDTWLTAWQRMPPDLPRSLGAFLGRITRNLAISRYRAHHAQKRYAGLEVQLSELEECVPGGASPAEAVERQALAELISRWLEGLPREERQLFLRRYWYGDTLEALAREQGCRPNRLAQKMKRLRQSLRRYLESEGVSL